VEQPDNAYNNENQHCLYKDMEQSESKGEPSTKPQLPRNKNCMSSGVKLSIALSSAFMVELIMLAFFS
jgi:hypothetical protein